VHIFSRRGCVQARAPVRLDFRADKCKYMYICVCKYGVNIFQARALVRLDTRAHVREYA